MAEQPQHDDPQHEHEDAPEDIPGEPGAEGGSRSPAADRAPGAPAGEHSALGDTDQHSSE